MCDQIFSEILNLEEEFYNDGYEKGLADGEKAGQSEGRTLGLEKGFKKFLESGRLHGKSLVWANQIILSQKFLHDDDRNKADFTKKEERQEDASLFSFSNPNTVTSITSSSRFASQSLRAIPNSHKVSKHLKALYAFVESDTLSIQNTEEAVSDFDDRLKRARAKSKLIEKLIMLEPMSKSDKSKGKDAER